MYCSMEVKNPAADSIQLPLVRAQPGERVAGASYPCHSHLLEFESATERELYWMLLEAWMQSLSMTVGEVCDKCIFTVDSSSNQISPPFYLEQFSHPKVLC